MHLRVIIILISFIQCYGAYNNPYRLQAPQCTCISNSNCCQDDSSVKPGEASPCQSMIPRDNYEIEDEGDDFRIDGDTGLDCKIKRCEWTLPRQRNPCVIDASIGYNEELRDCYGSDIKFVGSSSCSSSVQDDCIGSCDIKVQNADSSHEGMWILKAVLQTGTGSSYTDNINVTFEGRIIDQTATMSVGAILGISIPLGFLFIVMIIILIFCCFCPHLFPWRRQEPPRNTRDQETNVKTPMWHTQEYAVPNKGTRPQNSGPPVPQRKPQIPTFDPPRLDNLSEVSSFSSDNSQSQMVHQPVLGRPIPVYPEYSRKVSQTASIHSSRVHNRTQKTSIV